jgi:hypothetical protein
LTGLPRSGTTLLERILDAHSQIVTGDEWDAFPRLIFPAMLGFVPLERVGIDYLDHLSEQHLARKRHVYFRFLSAAADRSLTGHVFVDKNPSLLPLIPVYRRLLPHSRLIIVLRDPRDVLVSCLMTHFPLNDFSVDLLSLEGATQRIIDDLETWFLLRDRVGGSAEVKYEEMVSNLQRAILPILDHLDLTWEESLRKYHEREAAPMVHSPSYDQVYRPLYFDSIGRWRNYIRHLEPVLPRFDRSLAALGYSCSKSD